MAATVSRPWPWAASGNPNRGGACLVRRAKVRDRGDVVAEEKIRFTSSILPKWARRRRASMRCCRFSICVGCRLATSRKPSPPSWARTRQLSPAVIWRLTAKWQADYDAWQTRDLSARRYVYVWADGVYLQARMEEAAECMLVLIGATPEGKKDSSASRPGT